MQQTPENKQTEPSQSQELNLGQTEKNGLVACTPCLPKLAFYLDGCYSAELLIMFLCLKNQVGLE